MKYFKLILLLIHCYGSLSQTDCLFIGNTRNLCQFRDSSSRFYYADSLPDQLGQFEVILIFSTARSALNDRDIERLMEFLAAGKGIYLGSEDWPLQAESNQITETLYSKRSWGSSSKLYAYSSEEGLFSEMDSLPAGTTPVLFPIDHRLKVDAWLSDEPLILSGNFNGGRIVIDGGYSRFYCRKEEMEINKEVLFTIVRFLSGE